MPVTPSEILVTRLARRSFLSLWSESNPLARRGKELCDLLVVCHPDVVIVYDAKAATPKVGST